jgi:hypothetical protein
MCHGHLGRAPSRAGRAWHIGGRTLFGPTQGRLALRQPKCATAILAVPLHGRDARGTSAVERCSALPRASPALRQPKCATAILAVLLHGRDARGTSAAERCSALPRAGSRCASQNVPRPSWPCPLTGGTRVAHRRPNAVRPYPGQAGSAPAKMCHGHLGRAPSRAGRAWHIGGRTLFGSSQGRLALRQPKCATAILAVPLHGRDARGTSAAERCSALPRASPALRFCAGSLKKT